MAKLHNLFVGELYHYIDQLNKIRHSLHHLSKTIDCIECTNIAKFATKALGNTNASIHNLINAHEPEVPSCPNCGDDGIDDKNRFCSEACQKEFFETSDRQPVNTTLDECCNTCYHQTNIENTDELACHCIPDMGGRLTTVKPDFKCNNYH